MSKAIKDNPRELLGHFINIIARDTKRFYEASEKGKLPSEMALDLVRYSAEVRGIIKDDEAAEQKNRKKISEMTDDELLEKTKEAMAELEKIQID